MTKKARRWWYGAALLAIAVLLLVIFRLELLFAFQRMRLGNINSDKLWAHRVNSYQRFNYLKDYFPGLETDVVFDKSIDNFRVYHPPAHPTGLNLDLYLKELKNKLWIDVKGIDTTSYNQALQYFNKFDGIKPYIIIESSDTAFVNLLALHGYMTSWMVPVEWLQQPALQAALRPEVAFVSQEDTYIPQLKKHFPGRKIITWALSFNNYFDLSHFRELVADTSIRVVLINVKSKGHI
jgi:hypothetical protein